MYPTDALCGFGDNGITFNSVFQSHRTLVTVEFLPESLEAKNTGADDPSVRTTDGVFILQAGGLQFENPDEVMPDTHIEPPYLGTCHAHVMRRLLVSPATFVPPVDDPNPDGLEEWTITIWPLHTEPSSRP
ncbi:hypothetical protein [Amycolatopsis sp. NPDC059021]|uniref:hypothetical protein n=1 Tax=Amycolatopsis sp. NPDC059021 TaxID=3346704 RepID=UPI003670D04C